MELRLGLIMKSSSFPQIRCRKCNRLLMKGAVFRIEIKCPKCGYLQLIFQQQAMASVRKTMPKGSGLL
ncbi:MAG: Com family DNA-binding transcriptional regulator [Nitrospina sp.]|nr:Com family DNA-binding transcriptional regulator [Nitrospina sp.]